MLRHLRLAIVPVMLLAVTGCSGGFTVDSAQRLEGGNDYEGALRMYDQAVQEHPKMCLAHRGRGRCLLKLGQPKEAELAYHDAVKADPLNVDAKIDLASVEEARKSYMEAKIQYDEAYQIDPKNLAVIEGQAKIAEDETRNKDAAAKYKEAIVLDPNSIDLHQKLAHVYSLMNEWDNAKKELALIDAIKVQPKKN